MSELVTTPVSFFEVTVDYARPSVLLWLDRAIVVQSLFDAFEPWGIDVDDVEVISTGKPSAQGIKFRLPERRASFFFGPSLCRFTRDSTSWETAKETIGILDAGLKTLFSTGKISPKSFKTIVALHVQPTVPFMDILKRIIVPPMAMLDASTPKTMASVLKWEGRKVTIDGSGQIANGIFIRYEREFPGSSEYDAIAQQLKVDEDSIFQMLDIREA